MNPRIFKSHRLGTKSLTYIAVLAQVLAPYQNYWGTASAATPNPGTAALDNPKPFHPNHDLPRIERPSATPHFSDPATDNEIFRAHVFPEPLVPTAKTSPAENRELAKTVMAFLNRLDEDDFSSITGFLETHPNSSWRLSLLTDLGLTYRHCGRFLRALDCWEQAWALGKSETKLETRELAQRAAAELAELNARLGRFDRLDALFSEIQGRDFRGPSAEKIAGAREGRWLMENRPEKSFRCGPFALDRIRASINPSDAFDPRIGNACSTTNGTSLAQVAALSDQVEMHYQMARREPGAAVVVPSVVHWKAGHYAALVREQQGRFLIQDPTFGTDIWVTKRTLDEESSGYALVPPGRLPKGWRAVGLPEGETVWGKGQTTQSDQDRNKPCDKKVPGCGQKTPMAQYAFHVMLASLNIVDTPVGYVPPRGPAVMFRVTYNQREANQPTTFTYSNLGNKWTFDWLAYVTDNGPGTSADVSYFLRGGGTERYPYDAAISGYDKERESRANLAVTPSNTYVRTLASAASLTLSAALQPGCAISKGVRQQKSTRMELKTHSHTPSPRHGFWPKWMPKPKPSSTAITWTITSPRSLTATPRLPRPS